MDPRTSESRTSKEEAFTEENKEAEQNEAQPPTFGCMTPPQRTGTPVWNESSQALEIDKHTAPEQTRPNLNT